MTDEELMLASGEAIQRIAAVLIGSPEIVSVASTTFMFVATRLANLGVDWDELPDGVVKGLMERASDALRDDIMRTIAARN